MTGHKCKKRRGWLIALIIILLLAVAGPPAGTSE